MPKILEKKHQTKRGSLNLGEEIEINKRNEKVATGNPHVISDILLNREDVKK